jgi:hypothetical protein
MRTDLLCQCGWGNLAIEEEDIPEHCPLCGFDLWGYFGLVDHTEEED